MGAVAAKSGYEARELANGVGSAASTGADAESTLLNDVGTPASPMGHRCTVRSMGGLVREMGHALALGAVREMDCRAACSRPGAAGSPSSD